MLWLTLSAAAAYATLAAMPPTQAPVSTRLAMALAWGLHLLLLLLGLTANPPHFGFASVLSMTAWLVLTVYAIESRLYPQLKARWTLAIFGAAAVVLALMFPGPAYPLRSPWLPLHTALGIASYGLLGAAVVHAALLQRTEKRMRVGLSTDTMLPLLTLERLTFRFVTAGFALLSATLVAGWWFSDHLHSGWVWDHKTAFSAVSWLILGTLLLGRWRLGWRGRTALRTLYVGAGCLLLGYVGSRFVLEVLLQRT